MAQYVNDVPLQMSAAVAKYHAVKLSTTVDRTANLTAAANDPVFGIVQETVSASDVTLGPRVVDVRVEGISTCIANSAIARGDRVRVSATEGLVETVAGATAKQYQVGWALSAAAAQNDYLEVYLTPGVQIDT